jgi:hypothetical protein
LFVSFPRPASGSDAEGETAFGSATLARFSGEGVAPTCGV